MADGLLSNILNFIDQKKQSTMAGLGLLANNPQEYLTSRAEQLRDFTRAQEAGLPAERNQLRGLLVSPEQQAAQQYANQQLQDLALGFAGNIKPVKPLGSIIEDATKSGLKLDLYEKNGVINLSRIVVPKELRNTGVGSDVMNQIVNYADATGNKVALTPSTDFGASSVSRLKDFYKKFGFVENKGKAKDFSTRETMYREPDIQKQTGLLGTEAAQDLSYRGSHTPPNAKNYGATLDDLGKIMPVDVYSSKGTRLYGLGNPEVDSQWFSAAYKAKGKPDADVTVYRAVPKGVKNINSGDWVTTSKKYAQDHGESALNGEYEIVSKKVKAKTLSSEGYPYEFGYNE